MRGVLGMCSVKILWRARGTARTESNSLAIGRASFHTVHSLCVNLIRFSDHEKVPLVVNSKAAVDFLLGLIARPAVFFLQLADQLFQVASDLIDFVVGQLAPPLFDAALHLL